MRTLIFIFLSLFALTVAWRTIFVSKKDRAAIRFTLKEAGIALAIAATGTAILFAIAFNNTLRIL